MKLEIKHLKGYLGTGLKIMYNKLSKGKLIGLIDSSICKATIQFDFAKDDKLMSACFPILRPLSDLTKHCEDLVFVPLVKYMTDYCNIEVFDFDENNIEDQEKVILNCLTLYEMRTQKELEFLYNHHFDIHGLIEQGLAIDINTLEI